MSKTAIALLLGSQVLVCSNAAGAQSMTNKSWVSSTGEDAGTCLMAAPCKTIHYALSVTNASGEVDIKDAGNYGTFVIDKAITVAANGVLATIGGAENTTSIEVRASATDNVTLRGLTINGHNAFRSQGIAVVSAGVTLIENCSIQNMYAAGVATFGDGQTIIKHCTISGNSIGIQGGQQKSATVLSDDVIFGNTHGFVGIGQTYGDNIITDNEQNTEPNSLLPIQKQ